ncbi:MAG TPA: protein kinase [Blastocatellia bacterium]|nr:protein kinase [Blastocatellia bacterium]
MAIAAGTSFDRYEVIAPLGKGGMGEVYLAQDTRLKRKIALKLLPAQFTSDKDRVRRFEQEAYAVSALNHPNIITIHEIGQVEGSYFIATEFIEGRTLRRRMAKEKIPLHEALDIATQITSALAAAHEAGIIHRDIKPENVMLRPDGLVKVLDFGLAKLTEKSDLQTRPAEPSSDGPERDAITHSAETVPEITARDHYATTPVESLGETAPGVVMGTARYMSPEQARGSRVDARTDLFSLGVVLYEMVAGRPPFDDTTTNEVIASILRTEPPPLGHFMEGVPEVLEWITTKALTKDREERYQTARELLTDLRRLNHQLDFEHGLRRSRPLAHDTGVRTDQLSSPAVVDTGKEMAATTGEISAPRTVSSAEYLLGEMRRHKTGALLAFVVFILALGGITFGLRQLFGVDSPRTTSFEAMKLTRFTTSGKATRAAISPDGKYVVYVTSDAGKQSLWVRQVATPNNVEIVAPAQAVYRGLTFSGDGNYVYYLVQEQNLPIQSLYEVPVLGGTPRKLMTDVDSPITFSPDGTRFAFVRRYRGQGEDALIVANADGTGEQKLVSRKGPDFLAISGPAWSPDGNSIACAAGSNAGGRRMGMIEIRVRDGSEKTLSGQQWSDVGRVAWLSGGSDLIFSATEQGATMAQIWLLSGGRARKVTNDLNDYRDMSLTADSSALVTVQSEARVNVWTAPGGDSSRARQITSGVNQYNGVRGISWAPDGRIVYVSRVSGSQDVWIMDADGSNQRQLTTVATRADVYPTVTSDGRYIVFTSSRSGSSNLWRMGLDGSDPKQLTTGPGEEFPSASLDGNQVVYTSTSSSKFTLWKVPIDGGPAVQLTDQLSQWPAVSPDGKRIACWYRNATSEPWRIAIFSPEGGTPVRIFDVPPTAASAIPVRWAPDGQSLDFVDTREGVSNIWSQPIGGGEPRRVTDFKTDQIFWFDWSRDGRLALSQGVMNSDVVLISGLKQP